MGAVLSVMYAARSGLMDDEVSEYRCEASHLIGIPLTDDS